MLPARTRLVENEAYKQVLEAIELAAYRYIERKGEHTLPYKEFLRARELGITLPEAKPIFTAGLLSNTESPEPVEIVRPKTSRSVGAIASTQKHRVRQEMKPTLISWQLSARSMNPLFLLKSTLVTMVTPGPSCRPSEKSK